MDNSEAMLLVVQPVLMPESLSVESPTPITNVAHNVFAQCLEVLSDSLVDENSTDEVVKRVKEIWSRVLEEMYAYKTEKDKVEKALPEKEVGITSIARSLVDQERNEIFT